MTTETYNSLSDDYKAANPRPVESSQSYVVRWCDGDGEMQEREFRSYDLAHHLAKVKFGTITPVRL